ncbi:uncharacterized protein GGS22DRAFT_199508 [Annulohypoxylon maeteangense]|uniref:uncharacterized protein n=1 Tax=Annulohypoxylon maeteangense TaxID=1927788 RepID=UPI002007D77E|nr:uncharacterized protein GGS22DRAFT_199508 [Annulohypoxylon maeteangense]KAI0886207.1 hypothetical protein GGS22DRAFT_199508 [Annulohypoxylon maeteangense]
MTSKKGRTPLPRTTPSHPHGPYLMSPHEQHRLEDNQSQQQAILPTLPAAVSQPTAAAPHDGQTPGTNPQGQGQQATDPLRCHICNKAFKSTTNRVRHGQTVHIGTTCKWNSCGKQFANEARLLKHLRTHQASAAANDLVDEFLCHWPGCDKKFRDNAELSRHIKIHNSSA